mmetsp:Transcript_18163/g.37834  ORF Transcript_18163/g.37834 Transcript_18163/m.37834 type:complete len:140 (-) Transcript_18163:5243-5662(-)
MVEFERRTIFERDHRVINLTVTRILWACFGLFAAHRLYLGHRLWFAIVFILMASLTPAVTHTLAGHPPDLARQLCLLPMVLLWLIDGVRLSTMVNRANAYPIGVGSYLRPNPQATRVTMRPASARAMAGLSLTHASSTQ